MAIVVPIVTTFHPLGINRAMAAIATATTSMGRMQAVGAGMSNVGRAMTLGVTAPIVALAAASVKTAAQFDVTMQSIRVNTDATAGQMEQARATAIKFGQDTIYSANDAADAFLELTKAGMTLDEVNAGGLASTLNLAATEGMNLADAGAIMAQTMNAFGVEADKSAAITDILAAGAVASTATVTDLAFGLKYVSSSAAAAGYDVDDTVTALAALNNAGLTASTAGTSLNQMLMGLQAPTKAAQTVMDDLGISVTDASGELLPMQDVIGELNNKMKDLSGPEKTAALKAMFNTRGMRAANILLKDGVEGWADLNAEVSESGKAQELADARMSGMAGSLERLRGSAETAGLAFGDALKPLIDAVTAALKFLLDAFTNLSPGMQSAIAIFLVIVAAIGPLVWIIGSLITAFTTIIGVLGMVTAAGMLAVLPWVLIGVAVAALAFVIIKYWDEIWGFLKGIFDKIVGIVKGFLDYFKTSFPETFALIKGVITTFIDFWKSVFTAGFNFIKSFISIWWDWIKTLFTVGFNLLKGIITGWFSVISAIFSTAFNVIFTIVETVLGAVKALFSGDFDKMWDIVKSGIGKILDIFKGFPGKILSALGNMGSVLYNAGKDLIEGMINGIKSMASAIGSAVKGVIPDWVPGIGKSGPAPSASRASGASALALGVPTLHQRARATKVTININGDRDPFVTARIVKRAVEGYDVSQGRARGEPLAVAW